MYNFFVQIDFKDTFKALQITITTPVTTAKLERCFRTLKRIKTFLSNTMGLDCLNSLAVYSVHKDVISQIPNFNKRVSDMFTHRRTRSLSSFTNNNIAVTSLSPTFTSRIIGMFLIFRVFCLFVFSELFLLYTFKTY